MFGCDVGILEFQAKLKSSKCKTRFYAEMSDEWTKAEGLDQIVI